MNALMLNAFISVLILQLSAVSLTDTGQCSPSTQSTPQAQHAQPQVLHGVPVPHLQVLHQPHPLPSQAVEQELQGQHSRQLNGDLENDDQENDDQPSQ